ncbi:MAG: XDD3 family exosortase-dependent surface protein [Cyanobacteriota bacterium]|nr:XDD3 family exosortase-dependent surface protein [Cyanobacteriota bacterium]
MIKATKNQRQNNKSIFSPLKTAAATACLLSLTAPSAMAGSLTAGSTFMLFLECNNDGIFHVVENDPVINGWDYTVDATGDNTDGGLYDIGGMAMKQVGNELYVAVTGGTSLEGEGYDRNLDKIFYGDLLFTPSGVNFQDAMEAGKLSGIHFTGSADSGADGGLGLYKNVSAKGVGAKNFGHSTQQNYANIVDSDVDNFFGDLGLENDYFDKNKGYNVIAQGTKVENDGFEMVDVSNLETLGLDLDEFNPASEQVFGFKFNIDALLPPREAKGIGILEGIAGEAGVTFDETWKEEIAGYDQNINGLQDEADNQQGIANTKQQEADYNQGIRDTAEEERDKIQNQQIKPRNRENYTAIKTSPGASGYFEAKGIRDDLEDLGDDVKAAQKVIDNNPAKIAKAEQERDAAQRALDAIPSEEDYLSNKVQNANKGIKDAYAAVEDLTPQKEAWEQHKIDQGYDTSGKWNNLTVEEKLAVQESFPGEWVALRQDGSASKQEQELETFSKQIEDFENDANEERQEAIKGYENTVKRRNSDITKYEGQIADAGDDKNEANQQIADIQNNGKNNLLSELNTLKQNAENGLNDLDGLTPEEKQEREQFYNEEIAQLDRQINYLNDNNLDDALNYLGNPKNNNGYYKKQLATAIKLDDRKVLDDNGQPEVYSEDDFKLEVPVYDSEGNQIGTEIQDIQPKEFYYNDSGKLKSRPVDLVGQPKTVASEYSRRVAENSIYNNIKNDNSEGGLKKISNDAQTAKSDALEEKETALNAVSTALADKDKEIEAKEERLLAIEDTIIAEQTQIIMAQRLEETEKAEAEEQALDEQFGVRTENNLIPTTPEEAEEFNTVAVVPDNEDENRVYVPEPSGLAGLFAVGLALAGGMARKKNR